jgi:hypothetical protein
MTLRARICRSSQVLAATIAFTLALIGGVERVDPGDGHPRPLPNYPLASAAGDATA